MSDSKKNPKIPPPDDFSKTTPNINISEEDRTGWDKTNFDTPSQTPADDWGKTVINYDVSSQDDDDDDDDLTNTHYSNNSPKQPDWGMTQANVNLNSDFEANDDAETGGETNYGATVPYFKLPEAEREKYQNIPPTPSQKAEKEQKEERDTGAVPVWFWVTAGLMVMFTFAVLFIAAAWFLLSGEKGFTVVVQNAPPGSLFYVDGKQWGVPSTGNEHKLFNLRAGKKTLEVIHPKFSCRIKDIDGKDGETINYLPNCESTGEVVAKGDCEKTLDEKTRESCAEEILDGLADPPDLDKLLRALNLLRINFASGSAEVPQRNRRILKKAAVHIKNLPDGVNIEVGGHTDNIGSDENNQKLSERRAIAVRTLLLSFDVPESRLSNKGYGEGRSIADNNLFEGRARNRRIEYTLANK